MTSSAIKTIGVIGAGAWGTALAQTVRGTGREVVIWGRRAAIVERINQDHQNPDYLPGIDLDPAVRATTELAEAAHADAVLMVTPAQHLRAVCTGLAGALARATPVVICAKGIEQASGKLMSDVVAEIAPDNPIAVLSGPTFAIEVAHGLPTAVLLAAGEPALAERLADAIGHAAFRPYISTDVVGAEIGGAVKNVIAIACGIVEGRQLGDNARAALIARGLAEMTRFGVARGGHAETMMGLSGLGDLVLTCTSRRSRNYSLGLELGLGRRLDDIMAEQRTVFEGVATVAALAAIAADEGFEMPIAAAVNDVLHHGRPIDRAINDLLARPFTMERH